jgi:hypothetical protein
MLSDETIGIFDRHSKASDLMLHGASEGSHAQGVVAFGLINCICDVTGLLILMEVSLHS